MLLIIIMCGEYTIINIFRNSKADNYSTTAQIIRLLVRTVAYGGNLLLGIP